MPLTATTRLSSRHHRLERNRRRQRRRHDAVEQQAGPDAVEPDARVAQQRGAVRRVAIERARLTSVALAAQLVDLRQRAIESHALLVEQRAAGIVGGREVRVDGLELEVLAREQLRQRAAQVVEPESEPVHAGVDLQVVAQPLLVAGGGRLHRLRGAGRRDGRRQPAVEQAVEIADAERAEHQDLGPHAGGAQHRSFLDVGAGEQIGAGLLERARHLARAVPVGVRLDDGNDAAAAWSGPFAPEPRDRSRGSWTGARRGRRCATVGRIMRPAARFSKRVNSRMKASLTTPVGPLRCLPMISSATPCAVGGRRRVLVGVDVLAVDEDDDVGVLLERARFAQVGQLRPVIRSRLRARGSAATARRSARSAPWRAPSASARWRPARACGSRTGRGPASAECSR